MSFKKVLFLLSMVLCASFLNAHTVDQKNTKWVTFQYATRFNLETVEVKFPTYPEELELLWTLGIRMFGVYQSDVSYSLDIEKIDDLSSAEAIDDYLEYEFNDDQKILSQNTMEKDGYLYCDVHVENVKDESFTKLRVIASKKCIYALETEWNKGAKHEHDFFVNSFKLIPY